MVEAAGLVAIWTLQSVRPRQTLQGRIITSCKVIGKAAMA
jgi:hypothetical protein